MKKFKLTAIATALSVLSFPAFASEETNVDQKIEKVSEQTARLEGQVEKLRKQLAKLTATKKKQTGSVNKSHYVAKLVSVKKDSKQSDAGNTHSVRILELGATPVVTSPYIGVRSQYDASDLVINIPSYDQDVRLLRQREKIDAVAADKKIDILAHPLLELSGKVEGQVASFRNYNGSKGSDVNLSAAELDMTSHVNRWMTGFLGFKYDNSSPAMGQVTRTVSSRLFADEAFISIGNFSKSPFYATIGQRVVPFGQYASYSIVGPLTMSLGKTKERSLLLGYTHDGDNGLYGAAYAFKGDTLVGTRNQINRYGATLGYQAKMGALSSDIGVDAINSIAESDGMQYTGAATGSFMGFGASVATEQLSKRVPGLDAHITLNYSPFSLFAEYTGATRSFAQSDMMFNAAGAKPRASHVEGVYRFTTLDKPSLIALGYSHTWQALAINLPEKRYVATYSVSAWKDTIESLEFRRDVNYGLSDTASGAGLTASPAGGFSNTVVAQVGMYF